jgi:hypothetical protein
VGLIDGLTGVITKPLHYVEAKGISGVPQATHPPRAHACTRDSTHTRARTHARACVCVRAHTHTICSVWRGPAARVHGFGAWAGWRANTKYRECSRLEIALELGGRGRETHSKSYSRARVIAFSASGRFGIA